MSDTINTDDADETPEPYRRCLISISLEVDAQRVVRNMENSTARLRAVLKTKGLKQLLAICFKPTDWITHFIRNNPNAVLRRIPD